jgi:hypothetical protein
MIKRLQRSKPAKSGAKQEPRRSSAGQYLPGSSGNPQGPRPGFRHKRTQALQELLDRDGEAVIQSAIARAKAGHSGALRLIFERLLAPQRRRTVEIDLPTIATPADVPRALAAVTAAAAAGQITPDEAAAFGSLISATRQALELAEIDLRLRKLEGER